MRTLFVKVNDRYSRDYQLSTSIIENEGKRMVVKHAVTPEALPHLRNMLVGYEALKGVFGRAKLCSVRMQDDQLVFDYVQGASGLSMLLDAMQRDDKEAFFQLTDKMLDILPEENDVFVSTQEFESVFGDSKGLEGSPAYNKVLFDFTAGNLILGNESPVFIDYEWYFDFPIPVDLIVVHFIECLYLNSPEIEKWIPKERLYARRPIIQREKLNICRSRFLSDIFDNEDTLYTIYRRYLKPCISVESLIGINNISSDIDKETSEGIKANILRLNELIQYRTEQLEDRRAAIEAKDTWIDEQQKLLAYKDEQIADREAGIAAKDTWIDEQQKLLAYKDEQIADRDAGMAAKDTWIEEQKKLLAYKDEQIADRDAGIAAKDAWVDEQQKLIEYRDAEIVDRDAGLAAKDRWIEEQAGMLEYIHNQLSDEKKEKDYLQGKLEKCQAELSEARQRLFNIENSRFWQMTKRWHKGL